jgi:hypothetical protein
MTSDVELDRIAAADVVALGRLLAIGDIVIMLRLSSC